MFKEATYIKSITSLRDRPESRPEFLLVGRSNVGKSSFINALLNRKNLARTSGTPGKTLTLNYYLVDDAFYLVDAPGYGYAKRSKSMKSDFVRMINEHITASDMLHLVFLLIDFKVGPTSDDIMMHDDLTRLDIPFVTIATKTDKVPVTRRPGRMKEIRSALSMKDVIAVSAVTKSGLERIRTLIKETIGGDAQ